MLIGWVGDTLSQQDFNSETLKETKLFTEKKTKSLKDTKSLKAKQLNKIQD